MGAVKSLRYYPASSDMAVNSVNRAYDSLTEILELGGPLEFYVSDNRLTILDCPLTESEQQLPQIRSLVEIMNQWSIHRITLERNIEKVELVRFLTDFKRTPDEIEADGGPQNLIPILPKPHIQIDSKYLDSSSRIKQLPTDGTGKGAEESSHAPQKPHRTDSPESIRIKVIRADSGESVQIKNVNAERIQEGLLKLTQGEKHFFYDRNLMALVPDIFIQWMHEGKKEPALDLMEKVGLGLADADADIRDAAAQALVLCGNHLAIENRLDEFLRVEPHLTKWIRLQTVFSPTLKAACRQLQLTVAHYIHTRRFIDCLPILDTLNFLSNTKGLGDTFYDLINKMSKSIADNEALGILTEGMMADASPESEYALKCLVSLGPHSGEWLLELLSKISERSGRIRIMEVIREIGHPILPLLLKKIAEGGSWYFLRNLVLLVGKLGNETHLNSIIPLLNHKDIRVQREALTALYNIGGSKRKSVLLSALSSADEQIKIPMVIMLGGLRDPEAVGPFLELLRNRPLIPSNNRIRLEEVICIALGRIGDPQALPILKEIAEPKGIKRVSPYNENVKTAAKEALEAIEKSQAKLDKQKSVESHESNSGSITSPASSTIDFSEAQQQVDGYIRQGDKTSAISLLSDLIKKTARAKQFQAADVFLEKMSEVDPMALSEIYKAGEIIETEKAASLDKDRMVSWDRLYDTLSRKETLSFYFALKERFTEANVTLIQQGQKNDVLFFIEQGELKVVFEKEHEEHLIKNLKAGDVAGAESFFSPTVSTVSVITQTTARLSVLDLDSLNQIKNQNPALENKLSDFCLEKNDTSRILLDKAMERRISPRFPAEGIVTVQLLYSSGSPAGKAFKGRLTNISAGGLCFFIKLQNKESAQMLLGRKLQLWFPLSQTSPENLLQGIGKVVAVHYQLSIDYSVHVQFDNPMDTTILEKIKK